MNKLPHYTKILNLGSAYTDNALIGDVIVQEKVDGSQFRFGVDKENNLVIGSKGCILNPVRQEDGSLANVDKLFKPAVEHLLSIEEKIKEQGANEIYFYAETLSRPKHNVLKYEKTPKNHIVLFDVIADNKWLTRDVLEKLTKALDIDIIPELYRGKVNVDKIKELLTTKSYLGNETVEGVVIKNYTQTILLGGKVFPLFTKYVNEKFRERHGVEWKNKKPKDNLKNFIDSFKAEARWQKAIIHLKEKGELETNLRDIGKLILEVQKDIKEEEADTIKKTLYKLFIKDIFRVSTRGLPEWYKEKLLENLKESK